jgi:MFS superfamily sulfate permease-like transporter
LIGVPAIFGLQTAFFPLIIYVFFGTSMQLSLGPEAVISILTASSIDEMIQPMLDDPDGDIIPLEDQLALRMQYCCAITMLVGKYL